jgi:DNA ligase-1
MKSFVELYHALGETTKTSEKVDLIVRYLSVAHEQDVGWAIHILRGGKLERAVSSREIREWASECAGIPLWLFEESYHVVGDLAETSALVVTSGAALDSEGREQASLRQWIDLLRSIKGASVEERKGATHAMWKRLSVAECLVFTKLMTGGLRIGVSRGIVGKALALVVGEDEGIVAHRLLGMKDPDTFSLSALAGTGAAQSEGKVALTPYPFFLAYPLEAELEGLDDPRDWYAEWKWDGIRAQIVVRGGQIAVWSRGEELVTESFPELNALVDAIPDGTVLDGELVAWEGDHPAPFGRLQQRLNRRRVSSKLVSEIPVAFIAYDLLELDGSDLRGCSMEVRRTRLSEIVSGCSLDRSPIHLSPLIEFSSWSELNEWHALSRARSAEGVMLKRRSSSYGVGRRRGEWWKWKVDPFTIDGVLMYAQKGHGRRADLYTDYTFGVWHGDTLVSFAKAYSGLTDAEIRQVDAFVKSHTRDKFGPVRTVEQSLVFEIAFEGIQASPRHKSGIAVRFPRISRWRKDKPASEADTLDMLKALAGRPGRDSD